MNKLLNRIVGKGYTRKFPFNIIYKLYCIFKPDRINLFGFKFFIPKERYILSDRLILTKEFEPNQTKLIKRLVKKGDTVLDIGANIGYYTLLLSKLVGENGRVYSFEPEKNNFKLLQKNVRENQLKNVSLFNVALDEKKDEVNFFLSEVNAGGHSLIKNKKLKKQTRVKTDKLDNLCRNLKQINLIKIDVEGAERKVFLGAKEILNKNSPIVVGESMKKNDDYLDILEQNDIKYFLFDENDNLVKK